MSNQVFNRSVVLVICNPKGGVCKTTVALNMGCILASEYGLKVCLIDGEKDGSLSNFEFSEALNKETLPHIRAGYNQDLHRDIPIFKQIYDVIIVDTAGVTPDFGAVSGEVLGGQEKVSLQSLSMADMLIVPITPSPVVIRKTAGFAPIVERWQMMRAGQLDAVMVLNMVKTREQLSTMVINELTGAFEHLPLMAETVRDTTMVKQAYGAGMSVLDFNKSHPATAEYLSLTAALVERIKSKVNG
ncbi:ParA family protein [Aeromonas caviae]|jgi:chromosome partitioning protein|uniref:CobQ/CobB/MinD/ParA nucleotide binding domain-containing protein n=1 Tax=Aeromonas caviae TaxID=648 RepID=A0A6S4TC36_AERCA|nr:MULTISPECIES: ParA family protein [Aeromonas]MBL0612494.1 ParA family protein [Aeromonas jandaei]BBQ32840.1 hypothetical protein WP2W18E01_P10870 [Aeromonas caviae]